MSTDEHVPSYAEARAYYVNARAPQVDTSASPAVEFDRFLARVRRDAAESTYAAAYRAGWLDGQNGSLPDPRMAYPEETP